MNLDQLKIGDILETIQDISVVEGVIPSSTLCKVLDVDEQSRPAMLTIEPIENLSDSPRKVVINFNPEDFIPRIVDGYDSDFNT